MPIRLPKPQSRATLAARPMSIAVALATCSVSSFVNAQASDGPFTPPERHAQFAIPASARIAALRADIARGHTDAVASFWATCASTGAPIVEPFRDDSTKIVVTFVYRDSIPADRVLLAGGIAGWTSDSQVMERVAGTDVLFRTVLVPSDTRVGYWFVVERIGLAGHPLDSSRALHRDSFNTRADSAQGVKSVFVGPDAHQSSFTTRRAGVPTGRIDTIRIRSQSLGAERRFWVYTPAGFEARDIQSAPMPMLILFDGGAYRSPNYVPTPTILDNLIAQRKIPPITAVFVDNEPVPAIRQTELAPNPRFADFVARELVPWMRAHYRVSARARDVIAGGSSLGGIAASFIALRNPTVIGNVISQSGSYWWAPDLNGEPDWLTRDVATNPAQPVRFYMEVGEFEVGQTPNGSGQVSSNRRLHDVLLARGYDVEYHEFPSGHEYLAWRESLPDALIHLLGR